LMMEEAPMMRGDRVSGESSSVPEVCGGIWGCTRLFADFVKHSESALCSSESSFLSNGVNKPKRIKVECGSNGRRSDDEEG
jgi:hypothetical protein